MELCMYSDSPIERRVWNGHKVAFNASENEFVINQPSRLSVSMALVNAKTINHACQLIFYIEKYVQLLNEDKKIIYLHEVRNAFIRNTVCVPDRSPCTTP